MKRAKESDKVTIPPLPTGPQFWDWKVKVAENFMAASGLGQIAYQYILEVERPDRTGEDFSMVFPQWVSIEAKLSAAVQAVLTGPMRQEVQRLIDKYRAFQIPVMGRWKLWVIHQHFQRDASLQQVHAYNDLQTVKYRANKGYVAFYNDWMTQMSISGPNAVEGVAKMALFLPEVRKCPKWLLTCKSLIVCNRVTRTRATTGLWAKSKP